MIFLREGYEVFGAMCLLCFFFWRGWKLDQFQEDLREKSGKLKNLSLQPLQIPLISRGIFVTSPKSLERWTHVCRISEKQNGMEFPYEIWSETFTLNISKETYTPEVLIANAPENWWSIRRSFPIGKVATFQGVELLNFGRVTCHLKPPWNASEIPRNGANPPVPRFFSAGAG